MNFSSGPDLPLKMSDHCITMINSTHFFLVSGKTEETKFSAKAFIYNSESGEWAEVAPLPEGRNGVACGVAREQSGEWVIFVAGGNIEVWKWVNLSVESTLV